jgi:hypothetical protein
MASSQKLPDNTVSEYLKTLGGGASFKPLPGAVSTTPSYNVNQDASNQDALSWLFDMLSRPEYAVTETASSIADLFDKKQQFDALSGAGHVLSAPFRGLFSTAAPDKITGSGLIQQITNIANQDNPNYKPDTSEPANINRGLAGFGLDVALDPLTYLTLGGSAAAKAAKEAAKAAEAAKMAGSAGATFAKTAEGQSAIKALEEAGALKNGQVVQQSTVPPISTDSLISTYRGKLPEAKKYVVNIFDNAAKTLPEFAQKGYNYGRGLGADAAANVGPTVFSTREEALLALAKEQERLGGKWVDNVVQDGRVATRDLPKDTAAASIDELTPMSSVSKEASVVGKPAQLDIPMGITPEGQQQTLREIINLSERQAGAASRTRSTQTVRNILKGQEAATIPSTVGKALTFAKWRDEATAYLRGNYKALSETTKSGRIVGTGPQLETIDQLNKKIDEAAKLAQIGGKPITPEVIKQLEAMAKTGNLPAGVLQKAKQMRAELDALISKRNIAKDSFDEDMAALYKKYKDTIKEHGAASILGDAAVAAGGRLDAAQTLTNMYKENAVLLESVFGKATLGILRGMSNNPVMLERTLTDIKGIFDKSGLLDDALVKVEINDTKRLQAQRAVLKHIGVDYSAYKSRVLTTRKLLNEGVAFGRSASVQQTIIRLANEDMRRIAVGYGITKEEEALKLIEEIVPNAINEVLAKNFDIKKLADMYKFISKNGILRTHASLGKGTGLDPVALNTYKQWEIYKAINKQVSTELHKLIPSGLAGDKLARQKLRITLAGMRMADEALRRIGIPVHIDYQGERIALSMADVIETVLQQKHKADLLTEGGKVSKVGKTADNYVELAFFNAETAVAPTKFLDSVMVMLGGGKKADIVKMLGSTERRTPGGKAIDNKWATDKTLGRYQFAAIIKDKNGNIIQKNKFIKGSKLGEAKGKKGNYVEWNGKEVKSTMADLLISSKKELEAKAIANIEYLKQITDADSMVIAEEALKTLNRIAEDPRNVMELLTFLRTPQTFVVDAAATVGASAAAAATASLKTELAVGIHATTAAESAFSKAQVFRETLAKLPKKPQESLGDKYFRDFMARENAKAAKLTVDDLHDLNDAMAAKVASGEITAADTESILMRDTSIATKELGFDAAAEINLGIIRINMGGVYRFFKNDYGQKNELINLFESTRSGHEIAQELLGTRVKGLQELNKKFSQVLPDGKTTVLQKAFQDLQIGNTPSDPIIKEAYDELDKHMSAFFDLTQEGHDALFGNQFFRTGQGVEYINETLKAYDVLSLGSEGKYANDLFDIGLAAKSIPEGGDILTAMTGQWRKWEIKDPIDFISRLNAASIHMATDVSVVSSFVRDGKKLGFVSIEPIAGWVKLYSSKKSRYTQLLPSNVYVEPEVAAMFHRMEEVGSASLHFKGKLGEFTKNYYDPLQSAWKTGITVYRPGHHLRNLFGDESMTFLDQGIAYAHRSAGLALQLMASRTSYEGVDLITILTNYGKRDRGNLIGELNAGRSLEVKAGGDVISGGKFGKLTVDELFTQIHSRGILPTTAVIEDIYHAEGVAGKFSQTMDKVVFRDTKYANFWGGISEGRDHFSRIKHFMQIVEKAQNGHKSVPAFKTKEALFDYAAKQVLKYHPDASLLTTGERMVARRLIPFYSWMSRALPAVMGAALTNPARVTVFNKASYNLAVAMGVNPDSLSDPFPNDQLFPSFLTEKASGPQLKVGGKYYGINPGIVTWDLANTFAPGLPGSGQPSLSGALSPITGQLSPLLRLPLELVAGTSLGTGSKINDMSDYIDQNIPGLNYLATISGYSPSGSVFSMLQGMGPDPLYQVAQGNRTALSQGLSFANYVTGLGLSELSKPNYINYAEIEKRNREAPRTRSGF